LRDPLENGPPPRIPMPAPCSRCVNETAVQGHSCCLQADPLPSIVGLQPAGGLMLIDTRLAKNLSFEKFLLCLQLLIIAFRTEKHNWHGRCINQLQE